MSGTKANKDESNRSVCLTLSFLLLRYALHALLLFFCSGPTSSAFYPLTSDKYWRSETITPHLFDPVILCFPLFLSLREGGMYPLCPIGHTGPSSASRLIRFPSCPSTCNAPVIMYSCPCWGGSSVLLFFCVGFGTSFWVGVCVFEASSSRAVTKALKASMVSRRAEGVTAYGEGSV